MDFTNSEAKVRDLEHVVQEKEREIQMLRDSIHNINNAGPVSEERVRKIENDLKEVSSLVKGLTAEMLDLKALVQKLEKAAAEKPAASAPVIKVETPKPAKEYPPAESPSSASVRRIREKEAEAARDAEIDAEPRRESEERRGREVLIIQPDGTMSPETKFGDDMIVADNSRYGRYPHNPRAGGRDADKKPLIYADEDDAVEIKRRRR